MMWVVVAAACSVTLACLAYYRLRKASPAPRADGVERIDRRRFIVRVGGASAAITVLGAGVAACVGTRSDGSPAPDPRVPWSSLNPAPNAGAAVTPVPGTRPELTPVEDHYTTDIVGRPPPIDEADWRLRIEGLVARPLTLSLADLRERYEPQHLFITLACIGNRVGGSKIGTTRWTGARLSSLLSEAGPAESATHLSIRAADGFHEVVALDEIRADPRIMLAYAWDGLPLTPAHGFPLRIYLPDRYGMKQPKWIEAIELIDHWEPGFWVELGWDREARMQATSVIDAIGAAGLVDGGPPGMVPIGGIAHAGARGISRVEVRVDAGPWQAAELRDPLSELTWVLWRFDWRFEPGEHTLTVRCFDGAGVEQIAAESSAYPDGATGLHTRTTGV